MSSRSWIPLFLKKGTLTQKNKPKSIARKYKNLETLLDMGDKRDWDESG